MRHTGPKDADRRLRGLLRAGDPAGDGADPAPEEVARWKASLRHAARTPGGTAARPIGRWLLPLAAAGLVLLVAVAVWRMQRPHDASSPVTAAPEAATGADRGLRTIRMTGPGGTRIIWSVNPDLRIDPDPRFPSSTGERS